MIDNHNDYIAGLKRLLFLNKNYNTLSDEKKVELKELIKELVHYETKPKS